MWKLRAMKSIQIQCHTTSHSTQPNIWMDPTHVHLWSTVLYNWYYCIIICSNTTFVSSCSLVDHGITQISSHNTVPLIEVSSPGDPVGTNNPFTLYLLIVSPTPYHCAGTLPRRQQGLILTGGGGRRWLGGRRRRRRAVRLFAETRRPSSQPALANPPPRTLARLDAHHQLAPPPIRILRRSVARCRSVGRTYGER